MYDFILQVTNIDKQFPGVHALKDVSFSVLRGEVHGLIGENGAGKSTLIKSITGAYSYDSGSIIFIDETGTQFKIHNPSDAKAAGRRISGFIGCTRTDSWGKLFLGAHSKNFTWGRGLVLYLPVFFQDFERIWNFSRPKKENETTDRQPADDGHNCKTLQ